MRTPSTPQQVRHCDEPHPRFHVSRHSAAQSAQRAGRCYSVVAMRNWVARLLLLSSACGSSTRMQDSAVVSDAGFLADAGAFESRASIDLDPCLNVSACNQFTHPGMCPTITYWDAGLDSALDAGACETRPTVPCDSDGGARATLDNQLWDLLMNKCGVYMLEKTVVVSFSGGCASQLYFSSPPPPDWPDTAITCFVRELQSSHFACADLIPCWTATYSLLAPAAP